MERRNPKGLQIANKCKAKNKLYLRRIKLPNENM